MDFSRSIRVHCAGMDCLLKNDVDVKKWSHPGLVGGRSCRGEEVSKALSSRSPFLYHSQFSHTGISSSNSHNFLVSILPLTSMLQFCAAHIYFSHSPLPEEKARVHFTSLINLLRSSKQPQPHFSHLFSRGVFQLSNHSSPDEIFSLPNSPSPFRSNGNIDMTHLFYDQRILSLKNKGVWKIFLSHVSEQNCNTNKMQSQQSMVLLFQVSPKLKSERPCTPFPRLPSQGKHL